ncbi:hypothetical protein ACLOJK_030768 [Asimina triloba]
MQHRFSPFSLAHLSSPLSQSPVFPFPTPPSLILPASNCPFSARPSSLLLLPYSSLLPAATSLLGPPPCPISLFRQPFLRLHLPSPTSCLLVLPRLHLPPFASLSFFISISHAPSPVSRLSPLCPSLSPSPPSISRLPPPAFSTPPSLLAALPYRLPSPPSLFSPRASASISRLHLRLHLVAYYRDLIPYRHNDM